MVRQVASRARLDERTKEAVYAASHRRQRPYTYDGVIGQYYFNGPVTVVNNSVTVDFSAQEDIAFWNGVDKANAQSLELYLQRYPEGRFVSLARQNLQKLRASVIEKSTVAMAGPLQLPSPGTVKINPKDGQRYVWIPPGTFMMGCSEGDTECGAEENPAHPVEITRGFWLGQTTVTVGAWKRYTHASGKSMPEWKMNVLPDGRLARTGTGARMKVTGEPPKFDFPDEQAPIVHITWAEAEDYCQQAGGRLPKEAEWEYAARAGTTSSRYGPIDDIAWYAGNSGEPLPLDLTLYKDAEDGEMRFKMYGSPIHGVAQKAPNAWKLYDMLGNDSQWTADWYDKKYYAQREGKDPDGPPGGQYRTLRVGSSQQAARGVRVSLRFGGAPSRGHGTSGVRCAVDELH